MLDELRKRHVPNTPIYLKNVTEELGTTPTYTRKLMAKWEKEGKIRRFIPGIYYFPKSSKIFGETPFDPQLILEDKYLGTKEAPLGYYADYTLANLAGITTQVPAKLMIVSNAASSLRRREISIGKRKIIIKAPKRPITKNNVTALSLLDLISVAYKYSELAEAQTIDMIKRYATKINVTKKQIRENIRLYPAEVSQELLEMGIYDVLA